MKKAKGKRMGAFNVEKSNREKRRIEAKKPKKRIMVCQTVGEDCDKEDFKQTVGNVNHIFCCEKGFRISLDEFSKTIT